MTAGNERDLTPREVDAYKRLLALMTPEQVQALLSDPAARQLLAQKAQLAVALEGAVASRTRMSKEGMLVTAKRSASQHFYFVGAGQPCPVKNCPACAGMKADPGGTVASGPAVGSNDPVASESSVFTQEEWALLASRPANGALSDPATRLQFDALVRANPAQLKQMRGEVARIRSGRRSLLTPKVKTLTAILVGVGLVLAVVALNQS